jgi:hypothetical protein
MRSKTMLPTFGFTLGDALRCGVLQEMLGYTAPVSARFSPGIIVSTPLIQAVKGRSRAIETALDRHLCGDFGSFGSFDGIELDDNELRYGFLETDETGKLNKLAILGRYYSVLSEYSVNGQIVWIMTEDVNGTETRTTVMLPSEY